jgi:hypothetical protein
MRGDMRAVVLALALLAGACAAPAGHCPMPPPFHAPYDSWPYKRHMDGLECRGPFGVTDACCYACDRIDDLWCHVPTDCVRSCQFQGWGPAIAQALYYDQVEAAIRKADPAYSCLPRFR